MRFTTPRHKATVIAALLAANVILAWAFDALHSESASIALTVAQVLGWYLVTRLFRGPGEPVKPARAWWRMTNRPLLSGVIGVGYGVLAVVNLGFTFAGYGSLSGVVSILAEVLLSWLFLTSFRRLRALAPARA